MARSPAPAYRSPSCDCLSRSPHRGCQCLSYRTGSRRDRRILSRIEEHPSFQSPQSFNSIDTQFTSSYQGSQSSGSAYSIGSYDDASSVTSTTVDLEEQRHTSPPFVATPTSSDASFGYPPPQYFPPQRQDSFYPPYYPVHASTWPSGQHRGHQFLPVSPAGQPADLAGIDHIIQAIEPIRFAKQRVEFVSTQGPSPTQHQHYPTKHEPWHTQSLRQDDLMDLDQQTTKRPSVDTALSPTSSNEKGSRRNGPLSPEARRNANIVRQLKACRRCVYMKETCGGGDPCGNCQGKKGRKWKAGCTRKSLDELRDVLFPAPITRRHNKDQVNQYIYQFGFWYLDNPPFRIKLDTGLSRPLEITVKEVEGMDPAHSNLHAFCTQSDSENALTKDTTIWNPPIVPYMTNKDHDVKQLLAQLRLWMDNVFRARHEGPEHLRWPWPCFEHPDLNWEGEIVQTIQEYFNPDLASHAVLYKAQCLVFFGYILDNSFEVHADSQHVLWENLQNPPADDEVKDKIISSETLTRFIKMIACGYALDLTKTVLSGLQEILHKMALGQETSTARTDLAFCLTFLLLVFLAQSQNRILMLSELSRTEPGIDLSMQDAETYISEMEHTLGSYMIHFHEFAIKRRKQPKPVPRMVDKDEQNALEKGLMERIAVLYEKYRAYPPPMPKIKAESWSADESRPETLDLGRPDINVFEVRNTHRLCWKFVSALLDR